MSIYEPLSYASGGLLAAGTASQFSEGAVIAIAGAIGIAFLAIMRAGLRSMLTKIVHDIVQAELYPNGGDNIRDQVDAIYAHLEIEPAQTKERP